MVLLMFFYYSSNLFSTQQESYQLVKLSDSVLKDGQESAMECLYQNADPTAIMTTYSVMVTCAGVQICRATSFQFHVLLLMLNQIVPNYQVSAHNLE